MQKKKDDQGEDPASWTKRADAGTELLGAVGNLIQPLAKLETACSRKMPGRLSGPQWESTDQGLQLLIEELAPELADLAGEVAKAAADVVKLRPAPAKQDQGEQGQPVPKTAPPTPAGSAKDKS